MIKSKELNEKLVCYYSDSNFMIREVNLEQVYEEAVCPMNNEFVFEETDIMIEKEEKDYKELAEKYKKMLDIISGDQAGDV